MSGVCRHRRVDGQEPGTGGGNCSKKEELVGYFLNNRRDKDADQMFVVLCSQ